MLWLESQVTVKIIMFTIIIMRLTWGVSKERVESLSGNKRISQARINELRIFIPNDALMGEALNHSVTS
jgi:hypothetical protein